MLDVIKGYTQRESAGCAARAAPERSPSTGSASGVKQVNRCTAQSRSRARTDAEGMWGRVRWKELHYYILDRHITFRYFTTIRTYSTLRNSQLRRAQTPLTNYRGWARSQATNSVALLLQQFSHLYTCITYSVLNEIHNPLERVWGPRHSAGPHNLLTRNQNHIVSRSCILR